METPRITPPVKERGFLAKGGPVRTALTPFVIVAGLGGASLGDIACAPQTAQGNDQSHEVFVPGVGKAGVSTPDAGAATGGPQIEVQPSPIAGGGSTPLEVPAIPSLEIPDRLDSLSASINALTSPLNSRVSQEAFEGQKGTIKSEMQLIKELLAKGDIEGARNKILSTRQVDEKTTEVRGVLTLISGLGDPTKGKFVPKELKQKHDPKDKYIKFDSIDPQVYDLYLPMIAIMVATDSSYSGGKG